MGKKHRQREIVRTPLADLITHGIVRSPGFLVSKRADELRELIAKRKVRFVPTNTPTSFDFWITKDRKIQSSIRGLEHLWACIYAYQWLADSTKNNGGKMGIHDTSHDADVARQFLTWAFGDPTIDWPRGLPTPKDRMPSVEITNKIFLLSCGFIFLHELGHLELGHLKTTTTKPEKKIQHEYDADDWAVQYVIDGCEPDELAPRLVAIALTFGLVGGVELEGGLGDIREHPFPPDRIMHFVKEHVILATQERCGRACSWPQQCQSRQICSERSSRRDGRWFRLKNTSRKRRNCIHPDFGVSRLRRRCGQGCP